MHIYIYIQAVTGTYIFVVCVYSAKKLYGFKIEGQPKSIAATVYVSSLKAGSLTNRLQRSPIDALCQRNSRTAGTRPQTISCRCLSNDHSVLPHLETPEVAGYVATPSLAALQSLHSKVGKGYLPTLAYSTLVPTQNMDMGTPSMLEPFGWVPLL